jgi:peptidyl-prolyl cis-trans isomerase B (cyclophilin B)
MRKRQIIPLVAVTLAIGLSGAASASAQSQAPRGAQASVAQQNAKLLQGRAAVRHAPAGPGCGYTNAVPFDHYVGLPNFTAARAARPYIAVLHTTQGVIEFQALTAAAPCTTYSFRFLSQRAYYNGTHCHRMTLKFIFVLQCGDPTGTGSGGPGYRFNDENLAGATYPAGTVAMANAGPNTNGSQFFFTWKDTRLAPDFTPFGKVIVGMDVLKKIALGGDDDQNGPGDGYPTLFVGIDKASIIFQ